MNLLRIGAVALLVAFWMAVAAPSPRAQTGAAEARKVVRLLDGTGFKYTVHQGKVWTIDFEGKKIGRSTVVVTNNARLMVIFVDIAKSAAIQKTPQLMQTLLHANHDFDYVKIGFDDDGDLFVRLDAPLRIADARQLKEDIRQLIRVSDDLYGEVGRFIKR